MSFNEGISFDDELAQYQSGIDIDDTDAIPEEVDEDETTPLPVETMRQLVFGGAA